jgi:hypothetical protein
VSEQISPEARPKMGAARGVSLFIYGALVLGLAGVALYMGFYAERGWTSPYVIAPAIGALWFSLRLLMIFSSRK